MDIEEAFTAYLLARAPLTALIGINLYPTERPQDSTLPAVTYITVSDVPNRTLTGQDALAEPYIQFTVYASTKASAKAVAKELKTALNDYHGTMSGVEVQLIELANEISSMYRESDGSAPEHIIDLEYQFHYVKE